MSTKRRALLSVSDKTGLGELASGLIELGFELVSTGGTHSTLEAAGVPVTAVSDVTGFPEMLDGRVKTLHPRIHGGILADRSIEAHNASLDEHGIAPIELVVVNLYPFREAAASPTATRQEVIEQIDIGGPTLVRAAAKNHAHVAIVVDPGDYGRVLEALRDGDEDAIGELRKELAAKAFGHTASYDAAISGWFGEAGSTGDGRPEDQQGRRALQIELREEFEPRYGENPHQEAVVFSTVGGPGLLGGMTQHQGKELSYNNLLDADAARRLVASFGAAPLDGPAVAIIKHGNPCGVGVGDDPAEAYERALACDPMSAFGSIVAVNRVADAALAEAMASLFVEVVLAPGFDDGALEVFGKKKNLRVLECPVGGTAGRDAGRFSRGRVGGSGEAAGRGAGGLELRGIDGGFLGQTPDTEHDRMDEWECITERQPSEEEEAALALAWRVVRQVRSNAIVVANAVQTVGIGAGQMSRVDSCRIAIDKAQLSLAGTAAGSDAFFPFPDGVQTLAEAGVTAVVQPGGSKKDGDVIEAANALGVAMLMTGRRHFRH